MKPKALIPAAGIGTRLKPFTFTKPKPMVYVAGKQIIGHILDNLIGAVDEVHIVVGYLKEKLMSYVDENYSQHFRIHYIEQQERKGLGHAVYQARDSIRNSPLLITLGDEIFDMRYSEMIATFEQDCRERDFIGSLGVKMVDRPQRYGIVELGEHGVERVVEKPEHPRSNLALAGVYLFENSNVIFNYLDKLINEKDIRTKGEYQLTDAIQLLIEDGHGFGTFQIDYWYDCGRPSMLLNVNRLLLEKSGSRVEVDVKNSVIIPPTIIGKDCRIENSVIGPYVSIAAGTEVERCVIANSIIGTQTRLEHLNLSESIIGDEAVLEGSVQKMNIGENTKIEFKAP